MALVYVALGSNLGDREALVLQAVHEMRAFSRVKKISTLSETEALLFDHQKGQSIPKYINAVVEIETDFSPQEILDELMRIEQDMGRSRSEKGAPREIDLDLIVYENETIHTDQLCVPHPRMHERRFVMAPLAELNPQWVHPLLKKTAKEILDSLPE